MAEKVRAAMCRRDVAIRDYFDIDHAVRRGSVRLDDPEMLDLVNKKVAVQGNDPPDMSAARLRALQSQVEAELAPAVRAADLASFDLERAFAAVSAVAAAIGRAP